MSATTPNSVQNDQRSNQPHSRTNPSDVFTEHIEDNPAICPRCFARQRVQRVVSVPVATKEANGEHLAMSTHEEADVGDSMVEMATWEPLDDRVELVYPPRVRESMDAVVDERIPQDWKRACPEPKLYCTECAAIDTDGSRQTLSKEELLKHAVRVSNRLREQDVEHDRALVLAMAKMLKSKPSIQARDDAILSHAVRAGIEKRRHGRMRKLRLVEDDDSGRVEIVVDDTEDADWVHAN